MRVVHLSSSDLAGGAARAAFRLHGALRDADVESSMLVRSKRSLDRTVHASGHPGGIAAKVRARHAERRIRADARRTLAARPAGYDPFSDDRCGAGDQVLQKLPPCDVVNLHWVKGLIDYRRFFAGLTEAVKVVWTLHDMNPLTGGCHYDHGCGRFMAGCGACPQLGSSHPNDLSSAIFARKQQAFDSIAPDRLCIVTPSRWLGDLARQSPLLGRFRVEVIPNGIDTEAFAPRDRDVARQTLGLPLDGKVVAFVAHGLGGIRKGFSLLREALSGLTDIEGLHLLSAGAMHELTEVAVPHTALGAVDNERLLSLVYSAADIFVIPSVQDNLPNTVIESLACGTPVVGFSVGGIPDMVEPGRTGWLAPAGDAAALCRSLEQALRDDKARLPMSAVCRQVAVRRYDLAVQAQAYARLYAEMCGVPWGDARQFDLGTTLSRESA